MQRTTARLQIVTKGLHTLEHLQVTHREVLPNKMPFVCIKQTHRGGSVCLNMQDITVQNGIRYNSCVSCMQETKV